jgi:hypothetical protein
MTEKEKRQFIVASMEPKDYAKHLVNKRFPSAKQRREMSRLNLWGKESAWNYKAKSPTHDYGIPQRHMKHNTKKQIDKFLQDPKEQIQWGLTYIKSRYKTPCGALQSWLSRADKNGRGGWY